MPLGSTSAVGYSAMLNLIGKIPDPRPVYNMPDAHLHLYGKAVRPNRKVGHITLRASTAELLGEQLDRLRNSLEL
jgi:5-(carboxyamino)imidazole ribonucleotide synthase